MTQHPEEGTLHAYMDGELSPAEAGEIELHVGECARCAAALAEARGLAAAASRVITALDAAPASAAAAAAPVVAPPLAPARRAVRQPIFRLSYARAAALLLLVGGTAVVVDRAGTLTRDGRSEAESLVADVATASDGRAAAAEGATATPPVSAPAVATGADLSRGGGGGITGSVAREVLAPARAPARRESDFTRRSRSLERATPAPAPAASAIREQHAATAGGATRDGAATAAAADALAAKGAEPAAAQAPLPPAAPPPRAPARIRLEEVVVTSAAATSVSRYRSSDGTILTLTEEPLRTSFAEESTATRPAVAPRAQQRAAAAMAVPVTNSYRWSDPERGRTYTLSGPLTVAELEALSKRLGELERLP